MATSIGKEDDLVSMLNHLIAMDFDAVEAYMAAIGRLIDVADQNEMRRFMTDHERHTQDLGMIVRDLGGFPPSRADARHVLTRSRVVWAEIVGDPGVLGAMKVNEDETNAAYEQAIAHPDVSPAVRDILRHHLEDEHRHRAWIEQRQEKGWPH